ncbi:MAG: PAS domain S-box protein [Gemmatimonadales bacterium]
MTYTPPATFSGPGGLDPTQLGRLVDHLPVLLWSADEELRVTSRHGGGLALLGPLPEHLDELRVGEGAEDPAEGARAVQAHQAALRGEPTTYEVTFRGRSFSARVEPLCDAHGRIYGVVGIAYDITDRRRVEFALRESETRLRTIIESEPECVKLVDSSGLLLDMNPAGLAMIEADRIEQVRGLAAEQIVAPDHRAAFNNLMRRVFAGGCGKLEFEIVGMKGTRRWLETHAVPLRGPDGAITAALGITRDVTQRKHAEQALRESEERLQLVTRATNDAVWDWDLVTNALWWGRGFEMLFGYAREEIEPGIESWHNRLHPEDRDRVIAGIRAAIDTGNVSWSSEYRFRRRDGSYADIYDRGYVIHAPQGGRPLRMVGSMMDVSERKRFEEQLQASRAALRLLATRHQDVREQERTRIAREIHDSLGQALTALKLHLAAAHEAAGRGSAGLAEQLSETAQMVDDLVKGVRRIATELRPPILDELGLPAAIEWLAHDFTRRTRIACGATVLPPTAAIPAGLATALFRIVQEALTNVARHAGAARVCIALDVLSDVVSLEVTDDGRGITDAAASGPASLGILGMRERAAAQGGVLEVGPRADGGTRVAAWFPPLRGHR